MRWISIQVLAKMMPTTRSVDEADIYKSAIDEGVSVSSAFSFSFAFRNACLVISHHSWSSSCFLL